MIRLGQLLKLAGIAQDGGEAKAMLVAGHVHVNGEVELRRGRQLHPGDVVRAGGEDRWSSRAADRRTGYC